MNITQASSDCEEILDEIGSAVICDREFLRLVLVGVLGRGHVLLEDAPGTGKTLTARCVATTLDLSFSRIQFTPDLLPSDITGTHVFDERDRTFEFKTGPVFANVVLADELNRASPKTQAALLEAMEEGQVTVGGETHQLPRPFIVIATQNPVEQDGTFPLPAAQLDRFLIKTAIGYPDKADEIELITRRRSRDSDQPTVETRVDPERVSTLREIPERVHVADELVEYVVEIARETRTDDRVDIGVSPRGTQRLFEAARAYATIAGREYVVPDDIKRVARPVLAHRLVLTPDATVANTEPEQILTEILDSVPVPTLE